MVEIFGFIGYFLERCERENSRIFWFVAILLALTFSSFDDRSLIRFKTTQTPAVSSVLAIHSEGDGTAPQSNSFIFQTGLRKRKKFDITFHRRLEQHFPDWVERMAYQKKQEEFYKLAMKKKMTKKVLSSVKILIRNKYTYIVGWGVFFLVVF